MILDKYCSEVPISVRRDENSAIKERLCRAAVELIRDNMTVFLDSSTTIEYVLPYLSRFRGLTVITNNPDIPSKLTDTDITVYSTGGKLLHHSNSYVGEFAQSMLRGINADLLLFSARGVSLDGKVTNSSTEDDVHKVMIENAAKTCLLVDSTKIGKTYPFTFCHFFDIDYVVSDKPMPQELSRENIIVVNA